MKKITYKTKKNDPRYLSVSVDGNKKLINGDKVRFIIWNLPAIKTCPYATLNCKKLCYAIKSERAYPNTKKQRTRNFKASLKDSFIANMIFTLEAELDRPINKGKFIVIRIHESGDFYNQDYTNKWLEICRHFESNKNVVFMAYTKSTFYFNPENTPSNLVVRASVWDDTKKQALADIKAKNLPIYTAVAKFNDDNSTDNQEEAINSNKPLRCRCKDCGECGACWNKSINTILCEIH